MSVQPQPSRFHPLPMIGHPDAFYVKQIEASNKSGDMHALESAKVGRYVTLAMDAAMPWEEKLRHFLHALKRHCVAPSDASPDVETFYQRLTDLVRRYASQEAVRFVAHATESQRLRGQTSDPAALPSQVAELKKRICGDAQGRPEWMNPDAWDRINRLLSPPNPTQQNQTRKT